MTSDAAGPVFAALADPTRRSVVHALADGGPLTPTVIATQLSVTRQTVSRHLELLGEAGLVRSSRSGREVQYELRTGPFVEAEAWMRSIGTLWTQRLGDLKSLLESGE